MIIITTKKALRREIERVIEAREQELFYQRAEKFYHWMTTDFIGQIEALGPDDFSACRTSLASRLRSGLRALYVRASEALSAWLDPSERENLRSRQKLHQAKTAGA